MNIGSSMETTPVRLTNGIFRREALNQGNESKRLWTLFIWIDLFWTLRTLFYLWRRRMPRVSAKWIYCRQEGCICAANCIFAIFPKYLQGGGCTLPQIVSLSRCGTSIFAKYQPTIVAFSRPRLCYFPSLGYFLFKEAQTAWLGPGIRPQRFWISELAGKRINHRMAKEYKSDKYTDYCFRTNLLHERYSKLEFRNVPAAAD